MKVVICLEKLRFLSIVIPEYLMEIHHIMEVFLIIILEILSKGLLENSINEDFTRFITIFL